MFRALTQGACASRPSTRRTAQGTLSGSTINWSGAGLALANASLCRLDADRQLKVFCAGAGAATHFIVDIVGYYR